MRIWLQSVGAIGKDPMWKPYEKVLVAHAKKVVRPDTEVTIHGVQVMTTGIDRSHYFESLNTAQVIDNAIKAEKEGYDAFAVNCMMDPGFYALKEVVNMPVAHALEACCYVAAMFAPKFALLSYNEIQRRWVVDVVKQYGLGERLVPSRSFATTLEALVTGFNDPSQVLKGAKEAAKTAADNGADMLVPTCGCLNMVLVANGIKEIEGIPVIDTVGTVLKTAELLVELKKIGLERVNRGLYSRVTKKELSTVRKMYGVK